MRLHQQRCVPITVRMRTTLSPAQTRTTSRSQNRGSLDQRSRNVSSSVRRKTLATRLPAQMKPEEI